MNKKRKKIGILIAILALATLLAVPVIAKKNFRKNLSDYKKILQERQSGSKQKKNAFSFNQAKGLIGKRLEEKTKKRADRKEIEKIQAIRTKE